MAATVESLAITARQTLSRDLSKAPAMRVGCLAIDPPLRTVSSPRGSRTLEPRVMRTLIVLAEAEGEVLSRDDLTELAWDGVIVGENAINRVISQLRKVLAELGEGSVRLETITKVGFRLVAEGSADPAAASAPRPARARASAIPRRTLLIGGIAVAGAALGYAGWREVRGHVPDPRALALWQRGQLTQKTGEPGTMEIAMGFYRQAVEVDPDYADAWGALAIAYRHSIQGFSSRKAESYEQLARSAAQRALALDPGQPDAAAVEVMFRPKYGRLTAAESDLRALVARHPDYWYGLGQLGIILREAGRVAESIGITRHQLDVDPMLPVGWANLALAHAYSGDLQQADDAVAQGLEHFPTSLPIWRGHYRMLLESGRYGEAAAVARDVRERPEYVRAEEVEFLAGMGEALSSARVAQGPKWRDRILATLAADRYQTAALAPILFAFGFPNEAFDALSRYYDQASEPDFPLTDLATGFLFSPPVLRHRADPRFAALLERTGLEAHWRETGSQPDFRRN